MDIPRVALGNERRKTPMRNANTVEFNGRKACINSYSDHPALQDSMNRQRENWTALFPNAIVKTERMTDADIRALVASENHHSAPWEIGDLSNGRG